ncbi:hypothetical protein WJX82_006701 [Trebouxia sp. C0006]
MRTKVPAKAVKRHYEEPKPALPRVSWTSLPDSILARIYCALLPVTKPLHTKHPPRRPNSKEKRGVREAREARQAKQLKFKLVCKAWLQGAGHGISEGQLCKMDLPKGQLPAGLHLRERHRQHSWAWAVYIWLRCTWARTGIPLRHVGIPDIPDAAPVSPCLPSCSRPSGNVFADKSEEACSQGALGSHCTL